MRRIIFAIACIALMVRPPLDHLPNPSLCWPKIDNLLKCSANHVQHEDTEPHEHCDIYHWCGKKLRLLGWRFLCSLTLCWLLTFLHVFSNHHTTNILQFRTWLSTSLTPIAYCMITDLSYQYKYHYYSICCITNRINHHECASFVHCKEFDVFPVIHEPQLHMHGQQISRQFAVATDWTFCTNTQLIDCDITDIKLQSRFVYIALRTGQCETALFGCKQMPVKKIPFVNDDSVSFPQNIQWIKPDCIDTHGSTMIPFEHFYSNYMESICEGVTSSSLECDLQSHQQTHTSFSPFLCIFLRLLWSPLCHEKWEHNRTLYGSNGICDVCKCRFSQFASWISFVVGSILQSNNVSFRRKPYFERFQRIGEASNPGPSADRPTKDFLNLYHCNPTSLVGKENHFDHMLDGIHFIAETSATQTAQKICTARFKSKNLKCLWSSPMTAYKQSAANLRGHAGGTALISPFPMHRGLEPVPSYLQKADRFVDGVVQYFPHLYMYCAVVYGPHINHRYCNPRTIMNQIMNFVSQKSVRYQGPACISGDFNCKLTDIECWPALRAAGWVDAAELSAVKNNHPIEGTSNDNARHSFILCNRQLAAALIDCRTIKQHLFSVHPVLHARFDYKAAIQSYTQWKLPKSFDRYLIDTQTAEHFAQSQCVDKKPKHDLAFHHDDIATLSHSWTCIAEQTLAAAAVDVEGKPITVRPGHMGRSSNNPFVVQPAAMPIIPRPREGDHQPISEQGSIELRRWGKQLHRLQSLVRQYSSYNQTGNQNAFGQLNSLWVKILAAKGFQSQFQQWILETDLGYVPLNLPTFEYCCDLKNLFAQWYTTQEHAIWLQRTKLKQLEIIVDIPQGGRLAFQQIRDDAHPPIHAIHYKREATMIKTRCTKEGTHCVRLQPGHNLVLGPICFHEQKVNIIQVHPDRIFFDRKVKWRSTNLQLSQEDFTMDPPTMHQHLHQAWSPYFCRDKVDDDQHTWEKAITFLEHVQDFPIMAHQPITGQQLYHAVKKTKLASSRGGDGFSTLDLRRLPMPLWELMATIFTKIEQKHLWPEAWTLAKTLCLPKTSEPKTPLDIRPITVMSKMYRVWGKIRGGQVADHLASHIPKTIGGPCAQVSSEMIAFYTADRIEEAISNKTPLSGVVLDIIKCYNSIPREPLKLLLCRLGIPHDIICTFFAAMNQLQRFFQVCDKCGPKFTTSTGIVEGCGFAVPCMLAIGIWADAVLSHSVEHVESVMFADDWSIFHEQPNQLVHALKQLLKFIESMKMKIAANKSWMWSTSALHRTQLNSVSHQCQNIPIINTAKDLGVDQNYTNKIVKKTWKARLTKVKTKLKATSKAKVPRSFSKTLVVNGALACGSYGTICTYISDSDHKTIRSAIAKATRKAGTGANPWMACNAIQQGLHPQFRDLCTRLATWKRYIRLFPNRIDSMQQRFNVPVSTNKTITGPVVSLRRATQTLGIQITLENDGLVCVYRQAKLHINNTPKRIYTQFLQRAWDRYVASNINRKDWRLNTFDSRINTIAYNKLQFREQSLMDAILTGKHITNELITKCQPRQDEKCVLCGQTDSRKHRFFHCPALAETREKYKSTLDSVKEWEPTQQTFALCPYDHNIEKFHLENQNLCFEYVIPSTNNDVQHLFVDGTAFFNDHPGLVIAGAAVVASQPDSTYSHLVCRQRVPGIIQNSYIGELFAILLALNHAWCVHIYSDCQALVEEITFVLQNRTLPPQWCQTHPVLWHLVARHILHRPSHCVHIQKVTAHQNWKLISQADLRWQAYVNNRVDYHAKQSIISDNSDTYKVRADSYQRQKLLTQTTIEYYAYLSDISKIIVDSKPKKVNIIENNFDPHQDKLQPCMHAHVVHNQHIEVAEYQQFPWGPIFLWRLRQWANQLTWSCHDGGCDKDISDIELTVDYILYTNSEPPVNLSKGQEKQYGAHSVWRLRDLNLEADAMGTVPLNQHVQLFRRAIQWMNKHPKFQLFPCQTKRKVDSLKPLGLSAWHRGYVCRPVLACGERTLTAVRGYFITDSGTRRDLSQPFNVHGTCKIQHPPDFT